MDDQNSNTIKREYFHHSSIRALKVGRVGSILIIIVSFLMVLQDLYVVGMPDLVFIRLSGIIPAVIFLFLSCTYLKKKWKLIVPFHLASLTGVLFSTTVMCVMIFTTPNIIESAKFGILNGLIITIFGVFLFASGARKYLIYLISVSLIFLFLSLAFANSLVPGDWALFSNVIISAVVVLVLSFSHEKLNFREFSMRRLAVLKEQRLAAANKRSQKYLDVVSVIIVVLNKKGKRKKKKN